MPGRPERERLVDHQFGHFYLIGFAAYQELQVAPVVIEDRVWIGARAIILKGVQIGHDSVIGAGAIVTRSVPPYSVVVGPAARIVRTLTPTDPTPVPEPAADPAALSRGEPPPRPLAT